MAVQTGLEGKPWYISAAVAVVITGILVFLIHATAVTSLKKEIVKKKKNLTKLEKKINEGRTAQKSLPQFREEVSRLQLELDKLLKVLPAQRKTQDLLRRIRTLTEQGDFTLLSFTPRRRSEREFYYEWPIQVRLTGSYHNLALFFDRVSRFSRIINVDKLSIKAKRGKKRRNQTISATFTMKTFLYIDRDQGNENEEDEA